MTVQAKFYVAEKTVVAGSTPNTGSVTLRPVTRGAANAEWASATPSGELKMHVSNPKAFEALELGVEYLMTFERYEPLTPGDGHAFVDPGIPDQSWHSDKCVECGATADEH